MDNQAQCWLLIFICCLGCWFYLRMTQISAYKDYYPEFYNKNENRWIKPNEIVNEYLTPLKPEHYTMINTTNSNDRLLITINNWHMMDSIKFEQRYDKADDLIKSGWPVANVRLCNKQIRWIVDEIKNYKPYMTTTIGKNVKLLNSYLEAFGQPETGFYAARSSWLGSQLACESLEPLNDNRIKTRYCIGNARLNNWPMEGLRKATIRIGLCLPETCDTQSFEENKEDIEYLAKFNWPEKKKAAIMIDSMYCLPDERSPIRQMPLLGRLMLWSMAAWIAFVMMNSIHYELYRSDDDRGGIDFGKELDGKKSRLSNKARCKARILRLFTIQNGISCFVAEPEATQEGHADLSSFDFCKSWMCVLIVLAHSLLMTGFYARGTILDWYGFFTVFVCSFSRMNDTFYIFFGCLITKNLLGSPKLRKNLGRPIVWLTININIFLRVFPTFFLIYWINRAIVPYLSNGPWWDYELGNSFKTICASDPWWKSIPYFGNWGPLSLPHCNVTSWFIICYLQLALVTPLLIYLIDRLPNHKSRFALTGFVLIISATYIAIKFEQQEVFPKHLIPLIGGFVVMFVDKFEQSGYFDALGRFGAIAIGCMVGYLLHRYNESKVPNNRYWPAWFTDKKTLIFIMIAHLIVFQLPVISEIVTKLTDTRLPFRAISISITVCNIIWPILNAMLILNLVTINKDSAPVRFMGHQIWRTFNKLSFSISMLHFEATILANAYHETANSYAFIFDVIKTWTFALTVSVFFGLLMFMFIEAPIAGLLKMTTHKRRTSTNIECNKIMPS